ncbi:MAG: glycoside hydrolase, partial [Bacteroidota bacterium]
MEKFICIHGHFYQPPRENPWLEEIELQESAEPYHDWNERITAECYNPNGVSRILNGDGQIIDIVNNYSNISFNFGPTLLSWMKDNAPSSYQYILDGDKESIQRFNGHGSAIAQVYNHIIMPLANRRDKETQVIWGIEDFRYRFGREPKGMWLSETAADIESLEVLAKYNIQYTILAPNQARRFRKLGSEEWYEGVNPKLHYVCRLPSGRSIVLFFYDGEVSQAIAFKGLLKDGEQFANHLIGSFSEHHEGPQLVHVATDGESYGHHHRHGDMALAYCLRYIEENNLARITNYSEYLSLFPPQYEVEIYDNSSWSCAHGVERWKSNCGCSTGGRPEWNQEWRAPIREA